MVKRNSRTRTEHCFLAYPLQEDQICRTDADLSWPNCETGKPLSSLLFLFDFLFWGSLLLPTSLEQMLFCSLRGRAREKKSIKLMHNGAEGLLSDFCSFRSTEVGSFHLRNVLLN